MSLNEIITLIIAFASLTVSISSFVYARKAYKFEIAKFQLEQQSKDVFLDFPEPILYKYGNYTILETKLQILNRSSALKLAVYFNVILYFGSYWKFLMPSPKPMMTITAGIFDESAYLGGLTELTKVLNKQEAIRMVIVDAETKKRITFSQDDMKRIEPAPLSYSWIVYTIIPNSIINYLSKEGAELKSLELQFMLHPKEWKSQTSHRFWTSFGSPSQDVLSCVFPNQKAG
ncbi:MAG: hypothetical protein U0Z26_19970 [Anaerolineales bacterium]